MKKTSLLDSFHETMKVSSVEFLCRYLENISTQISVRAKQLFLILCAVNMNDKINPLIYMI